MDWLDFVVQLGTVVLGYVGARGWLDKRKATKAEVKRHLQLAADLVGSLVASGFLPHQHAVREWRSKAMALAAQVGIDLTDRDFREFEAATLGVAMVNAQLKRLGAEASAALERVK